jgi:hypothetical protein
MADFPQGKLPQGNLMLSLIQRKATRFGERLSIVPTTLQDKASRAKNRAKDCFHRLSRGPAQATHPGQSQTTHRIGSKDFELHMQDEFGLDQTESNDSIDSLQDSEEPHQSITFRTEPESKSEKIRRIMREIDELCANKKENKKSPPKRELFTEGCIKELKTESQKEYPNNLQGMAQFLDDILSATGPSIDPEKEQHHLNEVRRLACRLGRQANNTAYGIEYDVTEFQEEIRGLTSQLADDITRSRAEAIVSKIKKAGPSEIKIMLLDLYKLGGEPDARINDILFYDHFLREPKKPRTLARMEYKYQRKDIQFRDRMDMAASSIKSDTENLHFKELTRDYLDAPTTAARKIIAQNLKKLLPYDNVATTGLIMTKIYEIPAELAKEVALHMRKHQ